MIEDGQVRELIKPTGGDWGGTRLDGEYMDFIKCLIGKDATKCINRSIDALRHKDSYDQRLDGHQIRHKTCLKF